MYFNVKFGRLLFFFKIINKLTNELTDELLTELINELLIELANELIIELTNERARAIIKRALNERARTELDLDELEPSSSLDFRK